jgi:hypothetical protein
MMPVFPDNQCCGAGSCSEYGAVTNLKKRTIKLEFKKNFTTIQCFVLP